MARELRLTIRPDGTIDFIYDDALAPLLQLGAASVERASHVEPHPAGGWHADMAPSGGPLLLAPDGRGFALRAEALAAEVAWLREHRAL